MQIKVLLFRQLELVKTFYLDDKKIEPYHRERYMRSVHVADGLKPDAVVEYCVETFKRFDYTYPNCRCVTYYSEDYMTLPEWWWRQKLSEKYGMTLDKPW